MPGRVIDARAEMVVDRDKLMSFARRDAKLVTQETMADAVCAAFCAPRGLARGLSPMQLDIHRRQHLEIATAILDNIPG